MHQRAESDNPRVSVTARSAGSASSGVSGAVPAAQLEERESATGRSGAHAHWSSALAVVRPVSALAAARIRRLSEYTENSETESEPSGGDTATHVVKAPGLRTLPELHGLLQHTHLERLQRMFSDGVHHNTPFLPPAPHTPCKVLSTLPLFTPQTAYIILSAHLARLVTLNSDPTEFDRI